MKDFFPYSKKLQLTSNDIDIKVNFPRSPRYNWGIYNRGKSFPVPCLCQSVRCDKLKILSPRENL
jgi:hypothetical protein